MTYSFRNRFRLQANRVDSKDPELDLDGGGGEKIVLMSGRGGPLSATDDLVIQGSGYSDELTAAAAGRRWRQALMVALARENISADFGRMIN